MTDTNNPQPMTTKGQLQASINSQIAQIRQQLNQLDGQWTRGQIADVDYQGQKETLLQELTDLTRQLQEGHN